jgi:hypothetical protein
MCKSRNHTIPNKFLFVAFAFEILDWRARKERAKLTSTYTKPFQVLFHSSTWEIMLNDKEVVPSSIVCWLGILECVVVLNFLEDILVVVRSG